MVFRFVHYRLDAGSFSKTALLFPFFLSTLGRDSFSWHDCTEASCSCFCSHLHRINALQQRRTLLSPTTMKHHHLINANRGEFASSVPIPLPTSHIHRTRSELQLAQDELLADYQDGRMYERICKSLCSISPVRLSLLCGLTIPLRFCFFSIWYPSALRYDG